MTHLVRDLRAAVVALVLFVLVLGLAYPAAMTLGAKVVSSDRAGGSLVREDGRVVGSRLIAQDFGGKPEYFQPRPSATSWNPAGTGFANRGPNQRSLRAIVGQNLRAYLAREGRYSPGLRAATVPVSAVTSSASSVDPHIAPADAEIQARRIAAVRRLPLDRVQQLTDDATDETLGGLIGDAGVNVLQLNLALDRETRR